MVQPQVFSDHKWWDRKLLWGKSMGDHFSQRLHQNCYTGNTTPQVSRSRERQTLYSTWESYRSLKNPLKKGLPLLFKEDFYQLGWDECFKKISKFRHWLRFESSLFDRAALLWKQELLRFGFSGRKTTKQRPIHLEVKGKWMCFSSKERL